MFSSLGLFKSCPCPANPVCPNDRSCPFSHQPGLPPSSLNLPVPAPVPVPAPAKRPAPPPSPAHVTSEPPRKLQKVAVSKPPLPVSSATEAGVPVLRINPAHSQVAIPVRQTMLKALYDHFLVLYKDILPKNPMLPSEHALKQEDEVYKKSTKLTYRNAVIQCIASIKRRPIPTSISHPSVGTESEIHARAEAQRSLNALRLTRDKLDRLIHPLCDLQKWGYFTDVPPGPGGDEPSMEGKIAKCERCTQPFQVKRMEEAEQCVYHWGRPYTTRMNGEKTRIFSCCSRMVTEAEGCSRGPHVFYESSAEDLHSRQPFSPLVPHDDSSTALDVVALDCEMVYSTGGMRVARVSVVDGSGKEIFDELVRMDEGVHIIDFNTRFSGISAENYATASLSLASVRESLNSIMDTNTILIGHALDNDLKTLRIIHNRCIDTALLFPHKAGPPYRRSLKDLVREKLGRFIQTGDVSQGHSSVEDASATLDLVRWYILNTHPPPVPVASGSRF